MTMLSMFAVQCHRVHSQSPLLVLPLSSVFPSETWFPGPHSEKCCLKRLGELLTGDTLKLINSTSVYRGVGGGASEQNKEIETKYHEWLKPTPGLKNLNYKH